MQNNLDYLLIKKHFTNNNRRVTNPAINSKVYESINNRTNEQAERAWCRRKPKGMCLMYTSDSSDNYYLKYGESTCEDDVAAFGLQDIIELLPKSIIVNSVKHWIYVSPNCLLTEFQVMYVDGDNSYNIKKQNKSLLQAAYEMLIWVIEKGQVVDVNTLKVNPYKKK